MKTGLFGGTFDPPHLAHVAVAEAALSFADLDRVIWIPAADPPHRDAPDASAQHRFKMVELVVAENDRFEVSDIEARRHGPSYTVETIRLLEQALGNDEVFLIIGGDSLRSFHTWREPEAILDSVRLLAGASRRYFRFFICLLKLRASVFFLFFHPFASLFGTPSGV